MSEVTATDVREALARFAATHPHEKQRLRLVLLFGSVARGAAGPDSDVDLAVDCAEGLDLLSLSSALSETLGREVDIVPLNHAGVPLLEQLAKESMVVHEGTPHSAARWRARTLSDLEVDRPWHARMRDAWLARIAAGGFGHGQP